MRITVDIEDNIISELLNVMGEKKKSPAISKAVVEFVKRKRAKEFGKLIREGAFDYKTTNEEVEKMDI